MEQGSTEIRKNLIIACRILSREGLVEGFGHLSVRIPDSDLFILTPRISLALVKEEDLLVLNLNGDIVTGKSPPPLEAPLHTAIFSGKTKVQAIARIHARRAGLFSVTDKKIESLHNHGSFFFGGVPVFPKTNLVSTPKLGQEVTDDLGDKPAILLRGNGQVTVGGSIPEAVMMAIYLEETADILYGALQIGTPIPLSAEESASRKDEILPNMDLERAWNYYKNKIEE